MPKLAHLGFCIICCDSLAPDGEALPSVHRNLYTCLLRPGLLNYYVMIFICVFRSFGKIS